MKLRPPGVAVALSGLWLAACGSQDDGDPSPITEEEVLGRWVRSGPVVLDDSCGGDAVAGLVLEPRGVYWRVHQITTLDGDALDGVPCPAGQAEAIVEVGDWVWLDNGDEARLGLDRRVGWVRVTSPDSEEVAWEYLADDDLGSPVTISIGEDDVSRWLVLFDVAPWGGLYHVDAGELGEVGDLESLSPPDDSLLQWRR